MRAFHSVGERHDARRRNRVSAVRTHSNGQSSPRKSTQRYRMEPRRKSAESCRQGEFHAAADGIDTIGANAYTIAKFPRAHVSATPGDDGMIAFAVQAVRSCLFFQAAYGHEPFHKNFHQFHEKTELLHRDDQSFVLIAKMLFHSLRGLPILELLFGGLGAALVFS